MMIDRNELLLKLEALRETLNPTLSTGVSLVMELIVAMEDETVLEELKLEETSSI